MSELICVLKEFVVGLAESVWGLITVVSTFCYDALYHLHVSAPRFEGLLIGITLAWVLLRRDKHPLLRVLSSPLKLVLDILDLAWDQCVEVLSDCWDTVVRWVNIPWAWSKKKVSSVSTWIMKGLRSLKDKLAKKKDD